MQSEYWGDQIDNKLFIDNSKIFISIWATKDHNSNSQVYVYIYYTCHIFTGNRQHCCHSVNVNPYVWPFSPSLAVASGALLGLARGTDRLLKYWDAITAASTPTLYKACTGICQEEGKVSQRHLLSSETVGANFRSTEYIVEVKSTVQLVKCDSWCFGAHCHHPLWYSHT